MRAEGPNIRVKASQSNKCIMQKYKNFGSALPGEQHSLANCLLVDRRAGG